MTVDIDDGTIEETLVVEEEPSSDTETIDDGDTEVETLEEGDNETETPKKKPELSVFEELELNKTYDTPDAALRALREKERTLTQAQMDGAEMRRLLAKMVEKRDQPAPIVKPTREELEENFQTDPIGTVREQAREATNEKIAGLEDEVKTIKAERYYNRVASSMEGMENLKDVAQYMKTNLTPPPVGMNAAWDKINESYVSMGLQGADAASAIPLLYKVLFGGKPAEKPVVSRIPVEKKNKAQTHSGQPKTGGAKRPDFMKMTSGQIREWAEKNGET